jgi:hypothetical protein
MLTPDPVRLRAVESLLCLGDRAAPHFSKEDYMPLSAKRQGSLCSNPSPQYLTLDYQAARL